MLDVSSLTKMSSLSGLVVIAGFVTLLCSSCARQPMADEISAEDYVAIQRLYAEFNTAIDLGLPDRYVATWTDDGEYTGGRPPGHGSDSLPRTPDVKGKEQLRAMARGSGGRHIVTTLVVTKTPEGAKATAYLLLMNSRNSPPTVQQTSVYDDTLVKTPQGWKFKKRINWRDDDDLTPNKPKVTLDGPPPNAPEAAGKPPR